MVHISNVTNQINLSVRIYVRRLVIWHTMSQNRTVKLYVQL